MIEAPPSLLTDAIREADGRGWSLDESQAFAVRPGAQTGKSKRGKRSDETDFLDLHHNVLGTNVCMLSVTLGHN